MNYLLRPRIWPSFRASSGVPSTGSGQAHSCDVPFRYASASILDFGFRNSDLLLQLMIQNLIVQISPFVLWFSRAFLQIFNPQSAFRIPQSSTRWHAHLHGLATAIHETSGLEACPPSHRVFNIPYFHSCLKGRTAGNSCFVCHSEEPSDKESHIY